MQHKKNTKKTLDNVAKVWLYYRHATRRRGTVKKQKVMRMNIPFDPDVYRALRKAKEANEGESMVRLINLAIREKYGLVKEG